MKGILNRHLIFWRDKDISKRLVLSNILFLSGLFLFYIARSHTENYVGYVVPDILLDNIPVFTVGYIFFQGAFLFILFLVSILIYNPKYTPLVLETSALFLFVRSLFMNMTHLTAPNIEYYNFIQHEHKVKEILFTVSSGNDLFFSGHTGFPFLMALIFWQNKYLRYIFLLCSIVGGVAVILGHLHYTIDVFSSFFISYGIFEISKQFFKKEYKLTN